MNEENRTTQQVTQDVLNGGVTSTTVGQRSASFIPLKELDEHAKEEKKNEKGKDPFKGIRAYRMGGGSPRY